MLDHFLPQLQEGGLAYNINDDLEASQARKSLFGLGRRRGAAPGAADQI